MAFEYKNSRQETYYLRQKGRIFYFSKKEENAVELPKDYKVVENKKTGLLMLKKKET